MIALLDRFARWLLRRFAPPARVLPAPSAPAVPVARREAPKAVEDAPERAPIAALARPSPEAVTAALAAVPLPHSVVKPPVQVVRKAPESPTKPSSSIVPRKGRR